jgi:thiol:disulfide interchange protein DsbD
MSDVFRRSACLVPLVLAATAGLAWSPGAWSAEAQTPASAAPSPAGINAVLSASRGSNEDEFLPPDQAFQLAAFPDGPDRVRLQWVIHEGYYLYKGRIKVATASTEAHLGVPVLPTGKTKTDEYFGKQEVYHDELLATVPVARAGGAGLELPIDVTYQGCADAGLCYPPITKNLKVSLPAGRGAAALTGSAGPGGSASAAPGGDGSIQTSGSSASKPFVSEQDRLAALIRDGNLVAVLATFFGIGVLLSFTPCVLPMIPILSGIIVGGGGKVTPGRGFSLAFTYVQGMALTYAAAGAAFVLIFKQAPQAFFQTPWIVMLFAALFIALAFAMFGAYTLQLPSALQTRLTSVSNQQKSGTYIGTFIMGALSALVVTACVAPALIAALSVISQTGQIARGAGALYATGLGMGVPLLLVGASAGSLLPRVGPWMDTVKSLFGVLFLGVAIYFVNPLLPPAVTMLLWSALTVISGFWVFALKARDGGPAPAAVRAGGLLALVYGVILLIGVAAGSTDPLQPLSTLRASNAAGTAAVAREPALAFETIKSIEQLQQRVAAATAAGKPVMLDFYADWCVSCKEMEKYTFTDQAVQAALGNAVLLRADVTKNDGDDQALLKHFGIFGPPTIAFYDPTGQEQRTFRVVGYMKAPEFAAVLRQAFAGPKAT